MTIIINLPTGGHAVVLVDRLANTVSTTSHDGSTVTRAFADRESLWHLAQVAAADERSVELIRSSHGADEPVTPRSPGMRSDSVSDLFDAFVADSPRDGGPISVIAFRDYCRERHAESRGDHSWATWWEALQLEMFKRVS